MMIILIILFVILIIAIMSLIINSLKFNKELREIILRAILVAENEYNNTTGEERLELATKYVYSKLPMKLRLLISPETALAILEKLVQKTFDEIKNILDYSKEG